MRAITPRFIKDLKKNEVLIFGSNEQGRHRKGLALRAIQFGAVYGQGNGHYGQTYAIPARTFVEEGKIITLPLDKIQEYVDNFIIYARSRPDLIFLVTKIGQEIAGLDLMDIAPMFVKAMPLRNVWLPEEFWKYYEENIFI